MSDHSCDHISQQERVALHQHGQHTDCHNTKGSPDFLFWMSLISVVIFYIHYGWFEESASFAKWYQILTSSVYQLINTIWWGIAVGILMVAGLAKIPRQFVMSLLGTNTGLNGILRATAAGVLLDLCSHGILMVGAKLYQRGASIGQVMAFLIASPWNSFSLTLILIALIGIPWTLGFIALSMLIAIVVGLLFDRFVRHGVLPENPIKVDLPDDFRFWPEAKKGLSDTQFSFKFVTGMLIDGLKDSRMVVRWILFGVLLAGLVRAFISPEQFGSHHYTFLTKRFDRTEKSRLHFTSAMTQLGHYDGDNEASYLELAQFLTEKGTNTKQDLAQLWRRIVFYIAISNTDDHLRNHGFIYHQGGWLLSPAYDINPVTPANGLHLNITDSDNRLDYELAMEVIKFFQLDRAQALKIKDEALASVSNWTSKASAVGLSRSEQQMMEPAFNL